MHQAVTFASYQEQMEFLADEDMDDDLLFDDEVTGNSVFDEPDLTTDLALAKIAAKAADGRKAEDIVCLEVANITTMTCYLLIVTGNSRPQNQAIAAAIMEDVEEEVGLIKNPEGTADSGWMLLDYGSVMVHIMTPKSRLYYNIEGQWRDKGGTGVDLEDILVPNKLEEYNGGNTMEGLTEEDDPFWS
eukprot:CAMPEP_0178916168 /NCGR_PEP_ID=MMETSP0786-20121207/12464_1 /TAXON_ID=186022 /ORGANISM="Thalassionema frauenfeldii, Strain CCMP 1798" /LENGTH=187 /DNA_ID=CAMNT_0020589423 /DNA_START=155 /DNA_END=718 /DNA_ORIENTATION=-